MTAVPDLTLPGLSLAFLAGLISFLSPCVLPLVPSYLGVIGGARAPLWRAAGFILGFGVVFIALGATASALGSLLAPHKILLGRVAGVLIVFFGLLMLGVFRLPLMMRDTRGMAGADRYGPVALGAAFAFGWSPCLGRCWAASWAWRRAVPAWGAAWVCSPCTRWGWPCRSCWRPCCGNGWACVA